jgi:glyoxylase-like metal-dependent hydrolase (beta-lactamase superfamily II)
VLGPLDLHHQGVERAIGSYLLETDDGPALFDCGPSSTLSQLKERLREHGVELAEVRHLLLSHIHLDHAGAAGVIAREHPAIVVHVSEIGAPHLVDTTRLEASARRLYGDAFDTLWGELAPVPQQNVRVVGTNVLGLECFASPGHASHHVVFVDAEGTAYSGDAAGVRITPERLVVPPTPPPDIDLEAWYATLDELERRSQRLALVHFGVFDDVERHLGELRHRLAYWEQLVEGGASEEEFEAAVTAELGDAAGASAPSYATASPPARYAGVKRYVEKVKPSRSRASDVA